MTTLRPELRSGDGVPCMRDGTACLMIFKAVQQQNGLIHGNLHVRGQHCAIGSYFSINHQTALPAQLIDEVAAVNDSVPHLTQKRRKGYVLQWLRWKLAEYQMPGFRSKAEKDSIPAESVTTKG